jgi:antitoxin HigA-1
MNFTRHVHKGASNSTLHLADSIHVPYQRVNDLVHGRRSMTPSTALRLAKFFDNSAGFWMNLQLRWDLYFAKQEEGKAIQGIEPVQKQP